MSLLPTQKFNLLVAQEDYAEILRLFDEDPSGVRRLLTRLSFVQDTTLHANALEAFRLLSENRASSNPEFFREIIRRHLWGMNDEGGNIDWSAPEIIAAVIAGCPDKFKEFVPYMYNAAVVEPSFHGSLQAALEMLSRVDHEAIRSYLAEIKDEA